MTVEELYATCSRLMQQGYGSRQLVIRSAEYPCEDADYAVDCLHAVDCMYPTDTDEVMIVQGSEL